MSPRVALFRRPSQVLALTFIGQLVSVIGSGLTAFGVSIEVYRTTGSATQYALIALVYMAPAMVVSAFAGVLVDRWDRRRVMLLCDLAEALTPLALLLLLVAGRAKLLTIAPWHFYLPIAFGSTFDAFRTPAYQSTATLLVEKRHLGRVSGLIEIGFGASQVVAPMLAALLLDRVGLITIVALDLASFGVSIATLMAVHFPRPPASEIGRAKAGSFVGELGVGWAFVRARPGLVGLYLFLFGYSLGVYLVMVVLAPFCLGFGSVAMLGRIQFFAGLGMLLGGVGMAVTGGPRRRMLAVLGFGTVGGMVLLFAALPPSFALVAAAAFVYLGSTPLVTGAATALLQAKVPPDLQGRIFALRRLSSLAAACVSMVAAGPLVEHVFEPAMAPGGRLASSVGALIGTGPGRGIAMMLVCTGLATLLFVGLAALSPRTRNAQEELPDAHAPISDEIDCKAGGDPAILVESATS